MCESLITRVTNDNDRIREDIGKHVAQSYIEYILKDGNVYEEVVPENDGTPTSPIIFKAADGENVRISAMEEISDFRKVCHKIHLKKNSCKLAYSTSLF